MRVSWRLGSEKCEKERGGGTPWVFDKGEDSGVSESKRVRSIREAWERLGSGVRAVGEGKGACWICGRRKAGT